MRFYIKFPSTLDEKVRKALPRVKMHLTKQETSRDFESFFDFIKIYKQHQVVVSR